MDLECLGRQTVTPQGSRQKNKQGKQTLISFTKIVMGQKSIEKFREREREREKSKKIWTEKEGWRERESLKSEAKSRKKEREEVRRKGKM